MKILIAILTAGLLVIGGSLYAIERSDEQDRAEAREWLQFSQAHHCKVIQAPTFWNNYVLWECDGNFHTLRRP